MKPGNTKERLGYRDDAAIQIGHLRQFDSRQQYEQFAAKASGGRRTFHWPLEFPEVLIERGGFHAFVGNPPFMGGQKITGNFGNQYRDYLVEHLANGQRGSADLCAYFLLRSRQLLREGGQVGFVTTNTIAQGDTREVGLDQLTGGGFVIPRAVPSRPWPGVASLEIAHLWLHRGSWVGSYVLDDQPTSGITSLLTTPDIMSGRPYRLKANEGKAFQGPIVLGMGFVLDPEEALTLIASNPRNKDVLFPYLNGEDLNGDPDQTPSRWVINFFDWPLSRGQVAGGSWLAADIKQRNAWLKTGIVPLDYSESVAGDYPECLRIVEQRVKPERMENNDAGARNYWWRFLRPRPELYRTISGMRRVLVHGFVAKFLEFAFTSTDMTWAGPMNVIASDCVALFALLQSTVHETWVRHFASSLENRMRYLPGDHFETFPFPDLSFSIFLRTLDNAGHLYIQHRRSIMQERREGLTNTYNRFHDVDDSSIEIRMLRDLHVEIDKAVVAAYGWNHLTLGHGFHETKQGIRFTISEPARREVISRLLKLNHERYAEEVAQGLHDKKKAATAKKGRGKAAALKQDESLFG